MDYNKYYYYDAEFEMRQIEKNGGFSKLTCHPNLPGFFFKLKNISEIEGITIVNDFEKYSFKMIIKNSFIPGIFIHYPKFENLNHVNFDKSLCLFNKDKDTWVNEPPIIAKLISLTYLWIIYSEHWLKYGIWLGPV